MKAAAKQWCIPCGAAGRPTPATVTLDRDPYCIPCAQVAGYSPEEISTGARALLVPTPLPTPLRTPLRARHIPPDIAHSVPSKAVVRRRLEAMAEAKASEQQEAERPAVPQIQQEQEEEEEIMDETKQQEHETPQVIAQKPESEPEGASDSSEAIVMLRVTSQQIDVMFSGLELHAKARLIQHHLDQHR